MDEDSIKRAVSEGLADAFKERRSPGLTDEMHRKHHDWLTDWIEKEKRKREMIDQIKGQLATMGIYGAMATALAVMWWAAKHFVVHGGNG